MTTETVTRARSMRDVLQGSEGRPRTSLLLPWLTRRQMIDISIALDALIVFVSFVLAKLLYIDTANAALPLGANYALVAGCTSLIHYVVTKTNQGTSQQFRPNALPSVLRLLLITFATVIVVGYALKHAEVHSRLWLALSFAIAFALIGVKNQALHAIVNTGRLMELVVERIAIYGDPSVAKMLKSSLEAEFDERCQIAVYDGQAQSGAGLSRLLTDGLNNEFSRLIFCLPREQLPKLKSLIEEINFLPVRIEICLAQKELQFLKSDLSVSPSPILISLDDRPHDDWGPVIKRIMDMVFGLAFLVLVAPVMAVVALGIKLDTSGPVFFCQRRHGLNHSIMSIWKFRTMTVQEDSDSMTQARRNDPRVTRFGRFLRRTSLDELPQLFNVLSGEMSLVGPRPHALAQNLYYSERIATYAVRHKVKPGITGWAQIKGFRGNSEDIALMVARAEADIWYIRNWSILLDLKIILLTPFVVPFQKNAY